HGAKVIIHLHTEDAFIHCIHISSARLVFWTVWSCVAFKCYSKRMGASVRNGTRRKASSKNPVDSNSQTPGLIGKKNRPGIPVVERLPCIWVRSGYLEFIKPEMNKR